MRITLSEQKFLLLFDTIIETHLMNTFNVMPNYLTVSNNTILVRVLDTGIVYISSDGSYTTMKLINGEEYTFSFNLSAFEKIIEQEGNIIVTDVRVQHEYDVFKAAGAITIRVEATRETRSKRGELVGETDITEIGLDNIKDWDFVIDNNGDYENLVSQVNKIIEKLDT